jgi:Bacterial SH3 domain
MKRLLLIGVAALLLATGAAQADAVYDDSWDWSGCKEEPGPQNDEQYYSCENGHDFEFFKRGLKRAYKRGGRICEINKFEELPGADSPRLVSATCKENGIEQLEVSKFFSCCGVLMIKRLYVTGIASADACIVQDPTGTPLNVRKRPSQHAPIIGALNNGTTISTRMSRGDWVHIVPQKLSGKSGWVWRKFIDCPPRPTEQSLPVPKLPEDIEIAWRCDGMIIAIVEKQLKGVSRGGTYMGDDVETTIWIYNPLRLPFPTTFMFKQYATAHPYSTWSAELVGGQCQEVFFGGALEDRLPERIRNLAKIVRLEKSDEFKRCIKENPDEHQMCRDVAEEKLNTKERSP